MYSSEKEQPGKALERVLAGLEPQERPAFLEHLERKAKASADLEFLREIRGYREMSRSLPISTKPPPED